MLPLCLAAAFAAAPDTLPGTKPLEPRPDFAKDMVAGINRFLVAEAGRADKGREKTFSLAKLADHRKHLADILGTRDKRHPAAAPELIATLDAPALVGRGKTYDIFAVRFRAFGEVHAEGLMLVPKGKPAASVVAIPDADVTPEQLCGLAPGVGPKMQYARKLAEAGCRVFVPCLVSRKYESRMGGVKMTDREYIYRPAFELGRHVIGYELNKILAAVDYFASDAKARVGVGVVGWGEGGLLALYAAALDDRIDAVLTSGYIGEKTPYFKQPLDRNVWARLLTFGDAELLAMIAPRAAVVLVETNPAVALPSEGGAPAELAAEPSMKLADAVTDRAKAIHAGKWAGLSNTCGDMGDGLAKLLAAFGLMPAAETAAPEILRKTFDPEPRRKRTLAELDRHTQAVLAESEYVRRDFMPIADQFGQPDDKKKLDTSSLAAYEKSVERYRTTFAEDVIGKFDAKPLPFNAKTRKVSETPNVVTYQVTLDVFTDVFAYGLLLLPADIKPGEKRPVVVCQHGLEGRPEDCIGEKQGFGSYKAFATNLAERGFIVFAPQNPYIGRDDFRVLQRMANPLKKSLFSIIVPQHQQITDWLATLPQVDAKRIAFYGLSYGGKTAMRVPPLVKNYCLSICSADFNDWVWKNASTRARYSYVRTMEYEIFEWDLGSTFNYAEMAALIAPRPFMVERGHFDGVAPDERVALEFAKVRHLYAAKLGIGDRTEMEVFVGPHTINGKGTFAFLHKHLKHPAPGGK